MIAQLTKARNTISENPVGAQLVSWAGAQAARRSSSAGLARRLISFLNNLPELLTSFKKKNDIRPWHPPRPPLPPSKPYRVACTMYEKTDNDIMDWSALKSLTDLDHKLPTGLFWFKISTPHADMRVGWIFSGEDDEDYPVQIQWTCNAFISYQKEQDDGNLNPERHAYILRRKNCHRPSLQTAE